MVLEFISQLLGSKTHTVLSITKKEKWDLKGSQNGLHDGNLKSNMKQGRHKEFEHPNLLRDQDISSKKKTEEGTKMDGE